ncbi:MAG: DUF983 domain-containing protein [Chloroflexota bacterium]
MNKPSLIQGILRSRCPSCRQGPVFKSFMTTHKSCSICGTVYEREHGYFLMAIFVGYVMNGVVLAPIALWGYFTDRLIIALTIIVLAIVLLIAPTFHYSRMVWLYLDQLLDPRRDSQDQKSTSQDMS